MNIPDIPCKIEAYSSINPSEDPKKIEIAITNVLPNCSLKSGKFSISAKSEYLDSLEKLIETIQSRKSQKIYKRNF